jgi:hypothetical protein
MSDDSAPKSAYELAMERLRKKDADAGIERKPLTDRQRAAVSEVRSVYDAKLAQADLQHQDQLRTNFDFAERAALEEAYRRERERLTAERDAKIEKIRTGPEGGPADAA